MSFRTPRILQGCRTQICIVPHFQSVPFVIDEAFSDIQTHKRSLLPRPARCWRLWRDKLHYGRLNNRRVEMSTKKRENGKRVLIFIDVGTLMLSNGGTGNGNLIIAIIVFVKRCSKDF